MTATRRRQSADLVLHVILRDAEPTVWRRLRVPDRYTLHQLHRMLQLLFGWLDYHLYRFEVDARRFENLDPELEPDPDDGAEDSRATTLNALGLRPGSRLEYRYDFGDDWAFDLVVERLMATSPDALPRVLGGARAGPPEDAGGIHGYERLLQVLANPADPEHAELRAWAGADYNPEVFDVRAAHQTVTLVAAWGAL